MMRCILTLIHQGSGISGSPSLGSLCLFKYFASGECLAKARACRPEAVLVGLVGSVAKVVVVDGVVVGLVGSVARVVVVDGVVVVGSAVVVVGDRKSVV